MREIKFRGKRIDNGEWAYGHYIKVTPQKDSDGHRICSPDTWNMHPIIPETVGQYTGMKDKNGKEIFEGDVHEFDGKHFAVNFGTFTDEEFGDQLYGWYLGDASDAERLDEQSDKYVNIIVNIHESEVQE